MKKFAYIVCDNHSFSMYGGRTETRDYLICWYPNAIPYDSDIDLFWDIGLTWSSFEVFMDANKKIVETPRSEFLQFSRQRKKLWNLRTSFFMDTTTGK